MQSQSPETGPIPNPNSGSVPSLVTSPLVDPSRATGAPGPGARPGNGAAPINGGAPGQAIGIVEMDRYCEHCGFNLHGQQVFRDLQTELIVARCPECGRFHAASLSTTSGVAWLKRFSAVVLLFWIAFVGFFFILTTIAQTGLQVSILDEATSRVRSGATLGQRAFDGWASIDPSVAIMVGIFAAVTGFVQVFLLTVAAHHWRRWGYFAAAVFLPSVPLSIVLVSWWRESPSSFAAVVWIMLAVCACAMVGALSAAVLGRKLARLLAIGLVPPRPRQALAFLWTADGKTPPPPKGRRG